MLDNQVFPTPEWLIEKMLEPYVQDKYSFRPHNRNADYREYCYPLKLGDVLLEPSAGTGNIANYLHVKHDIRKGNILCVEIDPLLRDALMQNKFTLVGSDFLKYDEPYLIDAVIMNPPFAAGVQHILKAWEVVRDGGKVVCILNAETVRNQYSKERQLLGRIIEAHGRVEFIGQAFANAEVTADVECCIAWLEKPKREAGWEFQGKYAQDRDLEEVEFKPNQLASRNIIESIVAQYNAAKAALIEWDRAERACVFYTNALDIKMTNPPSINERIDALKEKFWEYILNKSQLGRVTTSDFQKKFEEYRRSVKKMGFTVDNVQEVLRFFFENRQQIMVQCIEEVFDKATAYHKDNIIHTEGWKTNAGYKVNKKVIMPNAVTYDSRFDSFSVSYTSYGGTRAFLGDLDRVMCYISGRDISEVTSVLDAIESHFHDLRGQRPTRHYADEFQSTFFNVRIFKKGTVHLKFLDEALWAEFNQRAALGKRWIGTEGSQG